MTNPNYWPKIWAYQAQEIEALAADPALARRASLRAHYSRIGAWLGPETAGRVLELGCGPGRYAALLSSLGHDVVAVDPVPDKSWDLIRKHRTLDLRDGVHAEDLPFPDGAFDHVACMSALLYFRDIGKAFSEVRRVTKPGGRIVMRTVNDGALHTRVTGKRLDPAARNYYTARTFRAALVGAGFDVKHQFSYGFYPPFGAEAWWGLVNGDMPIAAQELISFTVPPLLRVNLIAFGVRR